MRRGGVGEVQGETERKTPLLQEIAQERPLRVSTLCFPTEASAPHEPRSA